MIAPASCEEEVVQLLTEVRKKAADTRPAIELPHPEQQERGGEQKEPGTISIHRDRDSRETGSRREAERQAARHAGQRAHHRRNRSYLFTMFHDRLMLAPAVESIRPWWISASGKMKKINQNT